MMPPPAMILAGGAARRMGGGDKCLLPLGGRVLLDHLLDRLDPQAGPLALNAGGDPARFARWSLPVLPDTVPDGVPERPGPLAGILTAMDWAAGLGADRVVTVAGDTPFLPGDLIPRLLLAAEEDPAAPAIAASGDGLHPVIGLWPVALRDALALSLRQGTRRVTDWTQATGARIARFPATDPDAFFNINHAEDLALAEALLDRTP